MNINELRQEFRKIASEQYQRRDEAKGSGRDWIRTRARFEAAGNAYEDAANLLGSLDEPHILAAIRARINGEWDNPALMAFGPLDPAIENDILAMTGPGLHPMIGTRQRFTYPDFRADDGSECHPEYTAHTGQMVLVTRQLTNDECDPECQPMFEFQAEDGFVGHAHESELNGTARPLRPQDQQFARPV